MNLHVRTYSDCCAILETCIHVTLTFSTFLLINGLLSYYCILLVQGNDECGALSRLSEESGEIVSHIGFENRVDCEFDINCTWILMAPEGQLVELAAETFDLQIDQLYVLKYKFR